MYTDNNLKNLSNYKMTIAMQSAANENLANQAMAGCKPQGSIKLGEMLVKMVSWAKLILSAKPA